MTSSGSQPIPAGILITGDISVIKHLRKKSMFVQNGKIYVFEELDLGCV